MQRAQTRESTTDKHVDGNITLVMYSTTDNERKGAEGFATDEARFLLT